MIRQLLKNIIYAGHVNEASAEVRKQIIISSLFSILSFFLLLIFGLENVRSNETKLAVIVLTTAVFSGINYIFLYQTGKYRLCSLVIVLMMTILSLYLLCTGGNSNTGPLWMFVLPGLAFYILGLFKGLLLISVYLAIVLYILLVPDNGLLFTVYPTAFVQRFIGALFSVSFVAWIYEFTREDGRRELLNLSRKLDYLSRKDELTGLSNRRDMFERLRNELSRLERSGKIFSILIADIDKFKQVNDNYGHECGDLCLKEIAKMFSANTQKRDSVARWGGEEFLIFLPETPGKQAEITAERLRKAIENMTVTYKQDTVKLTTSIGVAEYQPGQTLNMLINGADKQLYLAKKHGRNRVERADG